MMTPVCRTNDQWTAKFRLASDPTKYASQPYVIFVQRVKLWAERLHFRRLSAGIEAVGADEATATKLGRAHSFSLISSAVTPAHRFFRSVREAHRFGFDAVIRITRTRVKASSSSLLMGLRPARAK